jgi:hypothetical protein
MKILRCKQIQTKVEIIVILFIRKNLVMLIFINLDLDQKNIVSMRRYFLPHPSLYQITHGQLIDRTLMFENSKLTVSLDDFKLIRSSKYKNIVKIKIIDL